MSQLLPINLRHMTPITMIYAGNAGKAHLKGRVERERA